VKRVSGSIAHGFPSLSLLSYLNVQNGVIPDNVAMGINYGFGKVRYLMPVRVGKQIRSRQTVLVAEILSMMILD
jgi:acyl dehydratase